MGEHRVTIRSTSRTIRVLCSCGLNKRVTDKWSAYVAQQDHERANAEPFAHDDHGNVVAVVDAGGTVHVDQRP